MSLTSVSPDNPGQGQVAPSSDDSNYRQPPNVPVPSANPMNTSELGSNQIAKGQQQIAQATLQGDQQIASASHSSSGGGMGGIFGAIGSIIGGLFAQGGYVNAANHNQYAAGGEVEGQDDGAKNNLLATGYLIGALHQSKFGGTPDTLGDAAKHIQSMLASNETPASPVTAAINSHMIGKEQNPFTGMTHGAGETKNSTIDLRQELKQKGFKGFAAGGSPSQSDSNLADQELTQALGLFQPAQPQNLQQAPPGQQVPAQGQGQQQMPQGTQNAMTGGNPNPMRGYATGGMPQQATQMPTQQPQQQGYMQPQGFAGGGMDASGPPTIQSPNQGAPAEGEIKGPGGPTDDLIPAKLSNGEFVMSAAATQYFGVDKLAKMNDQGKQGFMQKVQQVEDNQQQGGPQGAPQAPGAPPGMPPMGMMQPPPMQQAQGGTTVTRTRGSGYCGL